MKKGLILLSVIGLFCYLALSGYSSGPGLSGTGDRTGATTSAGCNGVGCHSSTSGAIKFSLQLYDVTGTTVISSYVGGTAYKVRIYAANATSSTLPKYGFQLAAVSTGSTSTTLGTLAA